MKKLTNDFSYYITRYFAVHLPQERNFSENTIASYRDVFKGLILFFKTEKGIKPDLIQIDMLNPELIQEYLNYLGEKGNSVSTQNQRLAVIKGFMKYLQLSDPQYLFLTKQILGMTAKKNVTSVINFAHPDGVAALLSKPNQLATNGFRDLLLLTLLYDSAARVSEIIKVKIGEIRTKEPCSILLHGKGNKNRYVPLSSKTGELLRYYLKHNSLDDEKCSCQLLFTNNRGEQLTRAGVIYILQKYVNMVRNETPNLIPEPFSPHCLRHSKAMHLLKSGVPLIYIRDFLGHSQITTEVYAKADGAGKRLALEQAYSFMAPNQTTLSRRKDDDILSWLNKLC